MNEEQVVPSCRLSGMSFSLYSAAEIRKLSVKEVTNPQTFDVLMHPTSGGLHDPAFGKSYPALGLSLTRWPPVLPAFWSLTPCSLLPPWPYLWCFNLSQFQKHPQPCLWYVLSHFHWPPWPYSFIPFSSATPPLVSPSPMSVISTTQHYLSLQ